MSISSLLAKPSRKYLSDGSHFRVLSAMDVLDARKEASELASDDTELALCVNACMVSKAWFQGKQPCYSSAKEMLKALPVSHIHALAKAWAEWEQSQNPSICDTPERIDEIKKVWSSRLGSVFTGGCSVVFKRSPRRKLFKT